VPHFDILKTYDASASFRAKSIVDLFTIERGNLAERFKGSIEIEGKPWNVGLIVGGSGTGKSTIARECFGDWLVGAFDYRAASVIDDMPEAITAREVAEVFTSVGFASPPSWLKPYGVLSNGEKMRVDLARAIMERGDRFAFDEFTSVVDRRVAQTGSAAIAKAVRKRGGQFVAVTCHHDVTEWLEPDWIFDTDQQRFFFAQANGSGLKSESMFSKLRASGAIKSGNALPSITISTTTSIRPRDSSSVSMTGKSSPIPA
jgi:ABC-type ATPase with predicted acetyltransferase domain